MALEHVVRLKNQDLMTAEPIFHNMMDNTADAAVLIGREGTVLYISPGFAELTGQALGEYHGHSMGELKFSGQGHVGEVLKTGCRQMAVPMQVGSQKLLANLVPVVSQESPDREEVIGVIVLIMFRNMAVLKRAIQTLEHSIGTSRSRNAAAFIQAIPFCLVLDRYAVVRPAFWSGIPAAWSAPATIGLVAAFLLVRRLLYAFFRPRHLSGESFDALRHNLYNYLLLLVPLLLLTVAVLTPAHAPDAAGRRILTGEILAVWAFALVRSGQILGAHGSGLSTFLYLCGLEILPAALLAAVVVFF